MKKPMCRLCHHEHWPHEPHIFPDEPKPKKEVVSEAFKETDTKLKEALISGGPTNGPFDRKAYQRAYMRQYMAKYRAKKSKEKIG